MTVVFEDRYVLANKLAKRLYDGAAAAVTAADRTGKKAGPTVFARFERASADLHNTIVDLVLHSDTGDTVETHDFTMIVNGISYGKVPLDAVLDGTAKPVEVTLTADGRGAGTVWHKGPSAEQVYYERYTVEGRVADGWVDAATRAIVQTG